MGHLRRLRRFLVTIATPIALTWLFAVPASRADDHPNAEATHEVEQHTSNPIQNFLGLHYGKNDHGGTWKPGEHKMPPPFGLSVLNYLAFFWLVWRFAGPGIRKATRERHDDIARALSEGTRLRDEARARLAEYEAKLAGLQGEIDVLVAGIRSEAETEKQRIIKEAEARAERMRRDAEQQIAAEMQRVRMTLEREAVEAAVAIAEKLLQDKTNDADQRVLADRFLKGLLDAAAKRRTTQ